MLKEIAKLDEKLFLIINGFKSDFFNLFFWFASSIYFLVIPLVILILLSKKDLKSTVPKIVFILLTIGFVDYTIYNIFKPLFQRFRPCYDLFIVNQVKLIGDCGGKFGFFSSHAGNSSALIFLIFCLFQTNFTQKFILFFWLFIVCLSRVYIGVHYPLDVIFGAFYGFLISKLFFKFYNLQFTTQ